MFQAWCGQTLGRLRSYTTHPPPNCVHLHLPKQKAASQNESLETHAKEIRTDTNLSEMGGELSCSNITVVFLHPVTTTSLLLALKKFPLKQRTRPQSLSYSLLSIYMGPVAQKTYSHHPQCRGGCVHPGQPHHSLYHSPFMFTAS